MPKRYNDKYQEGGQVPSDMRRLLGRLLGGPGQEDTERDMARAALMRESRDLMGGEEIPDWLAENPELLQELLRSRPIERPLPPLVTSENVGMMTPEEIKRWGGGNASGGIIGLQGGGPPRSKIPTPPYGPMKGRPPASSGLSGHQFYRGKWWEPGVLDAIKREEQAAYAARRWAEFDRPGRNRLRGGIPDQAILPKGTMKSYWENLGPGSHSPDSAPYNEFMRKQQAQRKIDLERLARTRALARERAMTVTPKAGPGGELPLFSESADARRTRGRRGRIQEHLRRGSSSRAGRLATLSKLAKGVGGLGLGLELLMSPERAGAAEVPERGLTNEEKQRLMEAQDELLRRGEMAGIGNASGGIIGLQDGGVIGFQAGGNPYQQRMVQSYVSPEVAQPYADLTSRIQQAGARPYTPYGGQRLAATTGDQALARAAYGAYGRGAGPAATQQAAGTMGQAGQMIGGAYQGMAGLQPQYAQMAGQFGQAAQGALGQAQTGATGMQNLAGRAELQGQLAGAGMRQTGAAAQTEQQQLGAQQEQRGRIAQTQMQGLGQQAQQAGQAALGAQQGFGTGMTGMGTAAQQAGQTAQTAMGLTGTQGQAQAKSAAERMRTLGGQAPDLQKGADLSQYMSQYTKGVTDPQLQQLMEFQKMQGQELGSQAAGAGAFGGSRQAVQAAEQAKAASQQAADIIGKGQQEAFESAQQAFQADRAAQQQAQQTGLSAEQQAAATQAGAQGQALAAQQAGIGAAQQGTAQQMQAQQQAAQMADVGAGRQLQGLQAQAGATAQGIGMGQQGLAAQQAAAAQGAQLGMQGQQQGFQAAQAGTQLGLAGLQQAGQLGQQGYGTMGRLMGQQQGAIGAQGQALGQMGQMGAQMGQLGGQQMQLGQQQQQQQMQRLQAMEQAGARTQQEQQRDYDIAYQDFQKQQQHPQQQIGWQLGAMQQLPYQNTQVIGDYGQAPSTASDIAGAAGAYSQYQADQTAAGDTTGDPAADTYADQSNQIDDLTTEFDTPDLTETQVPGVAHGGYLSSSGILAPYHKKLIDGLYAGGRINY